MDFARPQSNDEDGGPNNHENVTATMNDGQGTDDVASIMKFHMCYENWEEKNGELAFHHTVIIFTKGDEFFCTKSKNRYDIDDEIPIDDIPHDELNVDEAIPIDHIWPLFRQGLTIAPEPLPINSYIKSPCLLYYDKDDAVESSPSGYLLEEARTCEILRKNPHPNIAEYLGCVVHANRISGLCLVEYDRTLQTLVEKMPHKIDQVGRISLFNGIEAGIVHLHKLGLAHNNISPRNIVIDAENLPRIINFDSCQKTDEPLRSSGTPDWFDMSAEFSQPENDFYGLNKIRDYLSLPSLSPSCSSTASTKSLTKQ